MGVRLIYPEEEAGTIAAAYKEPVPEAHGKVHNAGQANSEKIYRITLEEQEYTPKELAKPDQIDRNGFDGAVVETSADHDSEPRQQVKCGPSARNRCRNASMQNLELKGGFMLKGLSIALVIALATHPVGVSQNSAEYQPGTIMKVVRHPGATGQTPQYDVSVKVLNTVYTVLYSPPPGVNSVEYSGGLQILVLVKKDTLVFHSRVSGTTEMPILRRETLAEDNNIDFSKAPGQYYSMKLRNLSERLDLSQDQQARIRPILEQEAGELNYVWDNPVLSQKEKLQALRRAVHTSDQKMKPLLTHSQWDKLESMRQQQEQELNQRLQEQKAEQHK